MPSAWWREIDGMRGQMFQQFGGRLAPVDLKSIFLTICSRTGPAANKTEPVLGEMMAI